MSLAEAWALYTVIGASAFAAAFAWAVRARQFTELDRQRRMALDVEPEVEEKDVARPVSRADRFVALALPALALLAIAAVMLAGARMW